MTDSKTLIVGPGALGCLLAVRLAQKIPGLWVLDRRPDRAAELQERGFHVGGVSSLDWIPPVKRVAVSGSRGPAVDWVIFAVRAQDLPEAGAAAARWAGPATRSLCLSEGWDAEKRLGRRWAGRTVPALCGDAAVLQSHGRVLHASSGPLLLDASSPGAESAARLMSAAGFRAVLDKKFPRARRRRLLARACLEPLAALAGVPCGRLGEAPLRTLLEKAAAEAAGARAPRGLALTAGEILEEADRLRRAAGSGPGSLSQDLVRGRPTERPFLLEPVLRAAGAAASRLMPSLNFYNRVLRRLEG
ncbi:MAG: ketopantoate reductase family protein [Elusimicrobiota bacterium]